MKKYFKSKELNAYEERLSKAQWFGGAKPSPEDATILEEVKGKDFCAADYPFLFAWLSFMEKFPPAIKS